MKSVTAVEFVDLKTNKGIIFPRNFIISTKGMNTPKNGDILSSSVTFQRNVTNFLFIFCISFILVMNITPYTPRIYTFFRKH